MVDAFLMFTSTDDMTIVAAGAYEVILQKM